MEYKIDLIGGKMKKTQKYLKLFKSKSPKRISHKDETLCWKLLWNLRGSGRFTTRELAKQLKITNTKTANLIKLIRERNHMFFNPTNKLFILADQQGFYLSNEAKELKDYSKILKEQIKSKTFQLRELEIVMEEK